MELASKSPRESEVRTSTIVMPEEANLHANLFGGALVAHIDRTAAICAIKHCRTNVVTASIDRLDFLAPARVGTFIHLHAMLTFTARTSMEILVTVDGEDPHSGHSARICSAFLTFVSLDAGCRPIPAPPLRLETDAEREHFAAGKLRYEQRKAERSKAKP